MYGKIGAIALIMATTAACGPVLREVRHPGGYPGHLLDQRTFDASRSKQLQLFRGALIMAMAARMGTATIRDGKDADAFVDYLAAASDEINYAAANIYPINGQPPCTVTGLHPYTPPNGAPLISVPADYVACAGGYYSLFESDVPMMDTRITRLMLAALPEDRVRSFLQDVAKGDVLSAGWSAIKAVSETTGGLHRATGVYRTGLELVAANMTTCRRVSKVKPVGSDLASRSTASDDSAIDAQQSSTVWDAAECLGLSHDELFSNSNEAKGTELGSSVSEDTLHAVMRIARTACMRLQINTDVAGNLIPTRIETRNKQCALVAFKPRARPDSGAL